MVAGSWFFFPVAFVGLSCDRPCQIEVKGKAHNCMLKTIEGIYHNGQIALTELPQDFNEETQVIVTFFKPGKINPAKLRQFIEQFETIASIQH
jgi:hypothetical protein